MNKIFILYFNLFFFTMLINILSVIKTLFLTKNQELKLYIITIIDGLVYFISLQYFFKTDGVMGILIATIAKLIGTIIGNKVSQKMMELEYEVVVYNKKDKGEILAKKLTEKGYNVFTRNVYTVNGKNRVENIIRIKSSKYEQLLKDIHEVDNNINLVVKEIQKKEGFNI